MDDGAEIRYCFEGRALVRTSQSAPNRRLSPPLPRITRLMALAIKLEADVGKGGQRDYAVLSRQGCISRSRLTQILNLLHLAPDIQERLLLLEPLDKGREVITEKSLRRLASDWHWERQRERFDALMSRRSQLMR